MADAPGSFEEFWPYYVSQHRHPSSRKLHIAGTLTAFAFAGWALLNAPLWLVLAPVIGYPPSWLGHFAFEKNRPASWHSWRYFAWSFRGDLRMIRCTFAGTMGSELERSAQLLRAEPA